MAQATTTTPLTVPLRLPLWQAWGLALLGGLLGALAFEPLNLFPLIIAFPLACFASLWVSPSPGAALRRCWFMAWVYCFGALLWLTEIRHFAPIPLLGTLGIALMAFYLAMYPALISYAVRRWCYSLDPLNAYFVFAGLWVLQEWFRTVGKLACPLVQLSHPWANHPALIQTAALLGERGVSLLILTFSGWLLTIWLFWRRRPPARLGEPAFHGARRLAIYTIVLAAWLAASVNSYRIARSDYAEVTLDQGVKIALVQPNVEQMKKLASYAHPRYEVRAQLSEQMTRELIDQVLALRNEHPDLILLPESAFTQADFSTNYFLRNRISELARLADADLFFGANRMPRDDEAYNSAWLVYRDGEFEEQVYDKIRLVPFGEALPYFDMIPGMESLVGIGSFQAGTEGTIFTSSGIPFGALICFESMFAAEARSRAANGAQWLAVITNDAWYGMSAGPAHHHHLSQLRAVETRRPVVRCANTGISSFIAPSGDVVASLALGEKGTLIEALHLPAEPLQSPYTRFGERWLWLIVIAVVSLFLRGRLFAKFRRQAALEKQSSDKA